jgi:Rps23 Pro-64 3,4-dihydroxylase Tpa1-like proline 4-hydroxylase
MPALVAAWNTPGQVRTFVLDDLLPESVARAVYAAFPATSKMIKRHSLRESKYFAVQLDQHSPLLEELVFAFQDTRVIELFTAITGVSDLLPDPRLYAAGISKMVKGSFLNPHLDNSHDGDRKRYRVLNSLFYATPDWHEEKGGSLELWDEGPRGRPRRITSKFNRLVMMETNRASWHSVTKVVASGDRTCVSNYFFREKSLEGGDYFHATFFRGRPEQPGRDLLLRVDGALRSTALALVKLPTRHIYKRRSSTG